MEDSFSRALLSGNTSSIPREYDWFGPLIGDWEFDYYDHLEAEEPRHVKGEWIFRRVLEGAGIEDLFICPSRATRAEHPQPDGEYGAALRIFNPKECCYDMAYACGKYVKRLTFRRENGSLVGTVLGAPAERWVFSEITENSFHWQNITVLENGRQWVNSNVYAARKETGGG